MAGRPSSDLLPSDVSWKVPGRRCTNHQKGSMTAREHMISEHRSIFDRSSSAPAVRPSRNDQPAGLRVKTKNGIMTARDHMLKEHRGVHKRS